MLVLFVLSLELNREVVVAVLTNRREAQVLVGLRNWAYHGGYLMVWDGADVSRHLIEWHRTYIERDWMFLLNLNWRRSLGQIFCAATYHTFSWLF
jgi:hypothetical protein